MTLLGAPAQPRPPPPHALQNRFWRHWSVYIIKTTKANTTKRSGSSAGLTRLQEQEQQKGSAATWRIVRRIKKVRCCDVTVRFVEVLGSPDFFLLLNAIGRSQICWKDAAFPVFNPLPGIFILFEGWGGGGGCISHIYQFSGTSHARWNISQIHKVHLVYTLQKCT